ncbi:MAG: AEC family transporter [Rubrivivax sp.]|nr:AEC family transporter [Rubrivivax sp.]
MQPILAVTIPFFALVLCGYLAGRQHVLPESAIPGLNVFVLYFALPCMLFRFGAQTPVLELLSPAVLGVWLVSALLIVFVTVATTLGPKVPMKDAAFGALVAAFPNTGFMGVPLMVALVGSAAAAPMIATILADIFVTSSLCIGLAQLGGRDSTRAEVVRRVLRGTLVNPLPWAIALGGVFSVMGWRLWGPLDAAVKMLGDAASPAALFTIGAVLWRSGLHAHTRTPARRFLPVALVKLAIHPLLVAALGAVAIQLQLGLTTFQLTMMILTAALPSASNVAMLAERYGADNGRIARIIMTSTVLAFASFTLLAWALGVQPRLPSP